MEKATKSLNGFTIEVRNNSITFIPEKNTEPWWRQSLDRKKEGFLCPEVAADILRIATNLSVEEENGTRVGKYNTFMTNLTPNPKSSQGNMKTKYKDYLINQLKSKEADLKKFYGKKILIYLAIYLREKRFETNDVDNFIKAILDAIKVYVGDDRHVVSVIADKKCLEGYPAEDFDFIEQILLVITDPEAKKDIHT